MAKRFKEIGKKAEKLIEQGNEAEREVDVCQKLVTSASRQVVMARTQLAAARETDEQGNPKGDVHRAQAQLNLAQNQLATSQQALASAKGVASRVNQEKRAHVMEIEQHNDAERSNLQALKQLKELAFSHNAEHLAKGIAERLNEAEDIRVNLLQSMGVEATANYVPIESGWNGANPWSAGSISSLDFSGAKQSYQGAFPASPTGGNLAAGSSPLGSMGGQPIGASVGPPVMGEHNRDTTRDGAAHSNPSQENGLAAYRRSLVASLQEAELPIGEQLAKLNALRNLLLCQSQPEEEHARGWKVRRKTPQQLQEEGCRYIDHILDAYRDELKLNGVADGPMLEEAIEVYREQYSQLLSSDQENGTYHLYDHEVPNLKELAQELNDQSYHGSTGQDIYGEIHEVPNLKESAQQLNDQSYHSSTGQDISGEIHGLQRAAAPISAATGFAGNYQNELMLQVANRQGFNKAPRVVSKDEFMGHAQAAGIIGFRTVMQASDGPGAPDKYVHEFEYEDNIVYNPSRSRNHSEGLYLATSKRKEGGHIDASLVNSAACDSADYGAYRMTMTFDPTTRFVKEGDIAPTFRDLPVSEQKRFSNSLGAYAAALGYDAMICEGAGADCDYTVVYNRTKLIVQSGYEDLGRDDNGTE